MLLRGFPTRSESRGAALLSARSLAGGGSTLLQPARPRWELEKLRVAFGGGRLALLAAIPLNLLWLSQFFLSPSPFLPICPDRFSPEHKAALLLPLAQPWGMRPGQATDPASGTGAAWAPKLGSFGNFFSLSLFVFLFLSAQLCSIPHTFPREGDHHSHQAVLAPASAPPPQTRFLPSLRCRCGGVGAIWMDRW